jgi:hypothetical protein
MRFLLCLLLFFLVPTASIFAQENREFNIRVFGGDDAVAPTTPTLSGSAISFNQADVSWTVSTDNFLVSGYVLYRDGLPISTTSLTNYSDVGLTASTTYVYSVRAFDPSFNYSSSSNLVSIITPAEPVVPVNVGGGGQGTVARIVLNELIVSPGFSTSTFYIKTARPARFEMRWGKTSEYELGYVVNDRFVDTYRTTLTELEPGTTYFYQVIGYTPFGIATVLERGKFDTLDTADFLPPANVLRFSGAADQNNVRLSWEIPFTNTVAMVRIVRSHLGFPVHPQDGVIIYQGTGQALIDKDILLEHSPVYYTAFVYDTAGNVSSGAVVRVYRAQEGESGIGSLVTSPPTGDGQIAIEEGFASTSPRLPADVKMPDLSQILIVQNGTTLSLAEPKLALSSGQQFVVSIQREAITVNLKTIIATLTDPTDSRKTYSVLLRLNKEKTAYEAVIAPLAVVGRSQITVDVYDYSAAVVGTYKKTITFIDEGSAVEVPIFPDLLIAKGLPILLGVLCALLGFLLFFLFFKRQKKSHEDNNW